jgi:hypothetical protein
MYLKEIGCEDMDFIQIELNSNRMQWRTLVNTKMNHGVPQKTGIF